MTALSKLARPGGEFSGMGEWYKAATCSDPQSMTSKDLQHLIGKVERTFDGAKADNAWYYETLPAKASKAAAGYINPPVLNNRASATAVDRQNAIQRSLNKPLPPLPQFECATALGNCDTRGEGARDSISNVGGWTDEDEFIKTPTKFPEPRELIPAAYGQSVPNFDGFLQESAHLLLVGETSPNPEALKGDAFMAKGLRISGIGDGAVVDEPLERGNKRSACDSFPDGRDYTSDSESDDIIYVKTKKVCVERAGSKQLSRAVSIISISSDEGDEFASEPSPVSDRDFAAPTPESSTGGQRKILAVPTSFPGQFEAKSTRAIRRRIATSTSPRVAFDYGDHLHPNNVCTHINFVADPDYKKMDFTKDSLPTHSDVFHALQHADHMTELASDMARTDAEEHLRCEAHRECAAARLESCSVGRYRYYWGHMSLEEYKEARVCICWDWCVCAKMCSRYADIICPCSTDIILRCD